jgi:hypothetical protein
VEPVWAWPFFLLPWAQMVPSVRDTIGTDQLAIVGALCGAAYAGFFLLKASKSGLALARVRETDIL